MAIPRKLALLIPVAILTASWLASEFLRPGSPDLESPAATPEKMPTQEAAKGLGGDDFVGLSSSGPERATPVDIAPTAEGTQATAGMSPYPIVAYDPERKIEPWVWRTIGDLSWPLTPDPEFAAMYPEDMDTGELSDLGFEKLEEFSQRVVAIGQKQFESGDYERFSMPMPKVESVHERGAISVNVGRYAEMKGTAPDGFRGLPQHCEQPDLIAGEVKIAWIRYRDHADLYRLQDEAMYLIRRGNKK
jgi:hypothetical protein